MTSPPPTDSLRDRITTAQAVAAAVRDGSRVAIGGSGLARKPLTLVRALVEAGRRDLDLWTGVGGLDVELLLAGAAIGQLHATYVGLEALGLAPLFRRLREEGSLAFDEWSEATLIGAVRAGAEGAPFAAMRVALGSDLVPLHADWRAFASPFDAEPLIAVPPVTVDTLLAHVDVATADGRAYILGDAHMDRLWALAAGAVYLSAERVVEETWQPRGDVWTRVAAGAVVAGVVAAPGGARPGGDAPWYRPDPDAVQALCRALEGEAMRA